MSKYLLLFIFPLAFLACGGGTTGTGNSPSTSIVGRLTTSANTPLKGVKVMIVQSKGGVVASLVDVSLKSTSSSDVGRILTSDVTDDQGQFLLELESRPTEVTLSFEGQGFSLNYTRANIPSGAATVKLNLSYAEARQEIDADSYSYEDEEGNEVPEQKEEIGSSSEKLMG